MQRGQQGKASALASTMIYVLFWRALMGRGAHVSAASGTLSLATRNTMRRTCSPTQPCFQAPNLKATGFSTQSLHVRLPAKQAAVQSGAQVAASHAGKTSSRLMSCSLYSSSRVCVNAWPGA